MLNDAFNGKSPNVDTNCLLVRNLQHRTFQTIVRIMMQRAAIDYKQLLMHHEVHLEVLNKNKEAAGKTDFHPKQ